MSATVLLPWFPSESPTVDESRDDPLPVSLNDPDFERFFLANYDRLVRSVTGMTGDREVARDAVQDAFVKASARWRRVSRYQDPVGWVRRVAINRSRDIYRADVRRRRREQRMGTDEVNRVEDATAEVAGSMHLLELLRELPDQQRNAASLYYIEGMTVAEVAAVLAIAPGTVKFHLNRARASLRDAIERQDHAHG